MKCSFNSFVMQTAPLVGRKPLLFYAEVKRIKALRGINAMSQSTAMVEG